MAAMDLIAKNYQTIKESQEWAQLKGDPSAAAAFVDILDHVLK
jgi:hypothetical protein